MKVPRLSKASIAAAASLLIDHYESAVNTSVAPPVPVAGGLFCVVPADA
jgi:hypothetical protein